MSTRPIIKAPHHARLRGPRQAGRQRLERCVAQVYEQVHGARIEHFHESLLGLEDRFGGLLGVIGHTHADTGPLFLETYLDEPIEARLAARQGQGIRRSCLAEVGNLSALQPGTAAALVSTLAQVLEQRGVHFAVFTATAATRRVFERLGAQLTDLGPADGSRLGSEEAEWGRYYDCQPRVAAMDIPQLCAWCEANPRLRRRLSPLWANARALQAQLRISA